MKKISILNTEGKPVKEIETPEFFSMPVREDIIAKCLEARKIKQPYAPFYLAGKQASASGKIRHSRRLWKTAYGKGISRVPRKIFWRRGTQFYWVGATIASARGGRRAHPPKIAGMLTRKRINKKEMKIAFVSALAATADEKFVKQRYTSISGEKIKINVPFIIEGKIIELKTKQLIESLKKILGNLQSIALPKKSVRAGKGKLRGRKYKKTAGLLFVIGNNEKIMANAVESKKASQLSIEDLAEGKLGRLVMYTEKAIDDLKKRIEGEDLKNPQAKSEKDEKAKIKVVGSKKK